ncbi:MAG: carbohydrate ABC transporter permease [Candidatus Nanopelagicaceae bacterium]
MATEIKAGSRTDKSGNAVLRGGAASIFLSPATIIIVIFLVIPAFWTIYLGITNYRLTGFSAVDQEIVGLDNFKRALDDPAFFNSLKVTFLFTLGSAIFGQAVLGFFLAWILFGLSKRVRNTVEIIVIAAWMVPSSVVSFLWIAFLNGDSGTLNAILGSQTRWLIDYPLESIIVFNIWRGTAFSMLLFAAAVASIPKSHLEVARVAGATRGQQLRTVVLPAIKPYILTDILLITLWTFNDFGPYLLTAGGPGQETELLAVFIYNNALRFLDFGYASAIAAIMLLINLILSLIVISSGRKRS